MHSSITYDHCAMVYDDAPECIHIGVGLMRCSFLLTGAMRRPLNREASDQAELHAFLCVKY